MNELAQIGGPVAAIGVLMLALAVERRLRLGGLGLVLIGGVLVAWPLMPDLIPLLVVAGTLTVAAVVAALAWALKRYPWLLPLLVLACVPARLPLDLGGSTYNLLIPLYVVIAAAAAVLALELARGDERSRELGLATWPLALFVAWSSLSLAWSGDIHEGSIEVAAFLLPFLLLALSLARLRWSRRLLLALLAELVAMALAFSLVGVYQWTTRDVFWNPKVIWSNAYAPYFRVNSVFWDPSVYGRFLVVTILACLVVVLALRPRWSPLAAVAIALLWLGLALSFSQSSFAALAAGVVAAALVVWRWRAAWPLTLAVVIFAGVGLATPQLRHRALGEGKGGGLASITGSRSELVRHGVRIAVEHPLVGTGVGGFKRAYADLTGLKGRDPRKAASHTTPITVAAEGGIVGLGLYLWIVAAALIMAFVRVGKSFAGRTALVCAIGLTAITVHSLFYASFFEDPVTWSLVAIAAAAVPLLLTHERDGAAAD